MNRKRAFALLTLLVVFLSGVSGPIASIQAAPLAQSSGGNALSFSGSNQYVTFGSAVGPNGFAQGAPTWVTDTGLSPAPADNHALQFNGTDQYVTFGRALGADTFTLETWFNWTGGATASSGTGGVVAIPLITKGRGEGDGSNVDCNYFFGITAAGLLAADFEDMASGGNHPVTGSTSITQGTWHHAAATYDGTTWKLYLDGNLDAESVANATPRNDSIQHAGLGTAMTSTGAASGYFQGILDEARIWNSARTVSEIQSTMGIEISSDPNLLGRWGMNEGVGTGVMDSSQPNLGTAVFTLEAWVNRASDGTSMGTGTGGLGTGSLPAGYPVLTKGMGEGESPANVNMNYWLGIATTGVIAADFEDAINGGNHPALGTTSIPEGEWHHVAATYDGNCWNLYLDGNLETISGLTTQCPNFTPELRSIQHAALASSLQSSGNPNSASGYFAGIIDEVRIWNRALTPTEISNNKDLAITSDTNLLARWGMNEGSGSPINSSVGIFPGTLTNSPSWVDGFEPPSGNQAPDAPTLNAPIDGATGTGTSPTLNVTVSDLDNDPLTVTFFGRPYASGVFAQIAQNTGVASGTSTTSPWASLGSGQTFEWYVTVSDGVATTTGPTWTFHTTPSTDPVFVGVGDIAACTVTEDTATGNIVKEIDGVVFTTGDDVYYFGTAEEYADCYAPTPWGSPSVLSRTRPIAGNHDWGIPDRNTLEFYFDYFGANATDAGGKSYYSYDIDSHWHVVNLETECALVGGCNTGSDQELWLKADLAANSTKNVIALIHKPRYSSGSTNLQELQPLWDDLYDAGVDILLAGHDHVYERTVPMKSGATPSDPPVADPLYGIRQFTVGMGGESHHGLGTTLPTSEVLNNTTYGIFKLTLHETSYDWVFLPIDGDTFTDSGTGTVHGAPGGSTNTTVSFQDGVDAYTGTRDTYIDSDDPDTIRGIEQTFIQDIDPGEKRSLLLFDLSSIPTDATISSAEIDFYVNTEGQGFNMHRMLTSWDEAATYTSLGRHFAADGIDAESAVNANWPGVDTYVGNITVSVPASTIQEWVDGTLANNGWLMIATHASDGQQLRSREYNTVADRPKLTVQYSVSTTAPTITISGTPLTQFSSDPGTPSAGQSYLVSGSNLTGDIAITAPSDFEISTTSGSGFGSGLTLPQSGGSVAATTIYVRFNRATAGTSTGDIAHTSSGATTQNVAVSGAAGNLGAALQFDGTDDFVTFGPVPDLTGLGLKTFTIETWFKKTGTGVLLLILALVDSMLTL